jgi:hypothetical protein
VDLTFNFNYILLKMQEFSSHSFFTLTMQSLGISHHRADAGSFYLGSFGPLKRKPFLSQGQKFNNESLCSV